MVVPARFIILLSEIQAHKAVMLHPSQSACGTFASSQRNMEIMNVRSEKPLSDLQSLAQASRLPGSTNALPSLQAPARGPTLVETGELLLRRQLKTMNVLTSS